MAVVQISKIQVRRGKKSQTSLPQLAGGEFGWAVDSQQLYIGNGSVSEGAPFVGNTEVLTERSNIFDLLGAYTYKGYFLDNNGNSVVQTGINSNTPFTRSLQNKLDDIINIRDFGAAGDYANGVGTDDTAAIQRAIDQIFLNPANKSSERSRRTIYFPAGVYKITAPIYISSYVNLVGDGPNKTVIFQDSDSQNILKTVAFNSTPGNYVLLENMSDNTVPTGVTVDGFTFVRNPGSQQATPIAVLDCLQNSVFKNCKFHGVWNNGSGEASGSNSAVHIRGLGTVTSEDILFDKCEFTHVSHGIYIDHDSFRINFNRCTFKYLFRGLTLAKTSANSPGQTIGPQDFLITDSLFDKIDAEACRVFANSTSKGHKSVDNKYLDVGNNSFQQSQPTTPVLYFDAPNCESINDYFQRNEFVNSLDIHKTGLSNTLVAYVPDVLGVSSLSYPTRSTTLFYNTPDVNPKILLKAPVWSSVKIIVDYTIRKGLSNLYRSGQITVTAHPDMVNGTIAPLISDSFNYSATTETIGSTVGGNIKFYASVVNMSAIQYSLINGSYFPSTVLKPTLVIRYTNPSGPGGNAIINYTVTLVSGDYDIS